MNKHAILSASGAYRWLVCTPSALLEQEIEKTECSVYAQEGTAAHTLAYIKLMYRFGNITVSQYDDMLQEFLVSSQAEYHNKEFEEYVDEFVEFVVNLTHDMEDYKIYFELKVNFSNVVPEGFGTADVVIVTGDDIHVIDLKFGKGIPVSAQENPQLRLYGIGVLNMFPSSKTLYLYIHQPRLASVDVEVIDKTSLLKWGINEVRPKADLAIKGEGVFVAEENACRFCKLRATCKVRADKALGLIKQEFKVTSAPPVPREMTTEDIAKVLDAASMVKGWISDVEAYALGQLVQGATIPGYKLVEGRSNRVITEPDKLKELLLEVGLKEEEIMEPPKMKGISKLESLIGKKLFTDLAKDHLTKPPGKLTMAPESDRRPGISTLEIAKQDFAIE